MAADVDAQVPTSAPDPSLTSSFSHNKPADAAQVVVAGEDAAPGSSPEAAADANADADADAGPETSPFKSFFRVVRHYSDPIDHVMRIVGFLAAVASGAALPLMTLVLGTAVNKFGSFSAGQSSTDDLYREMSHNALWLLILFLARYVLVYVHATCFGLTGIRATRALRQELIRSLVRQDLAYLDSCSPGYVSSIISSNADQVENGMTEKIGRLIQALSMLISAFVVAFTQQWALTLVTATTLPVLLAGFYFTFGPDARIEARILEIFNTAGGLVEEALSTIRIVTAFNAGPRLAKKYDVHLAKAQKLSFKKGPIIGVQWSVEMFTTYCAYALAWYYGIKLLNEGRIDTGGGVITVLLSVLLATQAASDVAPGFGNFTQGLAASNVMFRMIDRQSKIDSLAETGHKPSAGANGHVELRNVAFAYPSRPDVGILHGLSLSFEANKTTALVGASGSGKSTIVGLIERWYDPTGGSLMLDGHDIKDLNVRWLRSQIGLVQQEPVLFSDTIYNNVAHGLYGTSMNNLPEAEKRELVRQACIQANADGFIQELPDGYDTKVGERGGFLSGGQKQRIAIARSVISNPRILLLDEATSALDPTAERKVQDALDNVSKSRTTILIAHKLSTVQKADKIVVLNQGRVVEQGTHQELLALRGSYHKLVNAQTLEVDQSQGGNGRDLTTGSHKAASVEELKKEPTQNGQQQQDGDKQDQEQGQGQDVADDTDVARKMSLIRCVSTIVFKEQRSIWLLFLLGALCSAGSGGAFPAQAVLFGKSIPTLQLERGHELVKRGNFWALIYFVFGLGVLVCYCGVGFFWMTSAAYVTRFYRRQYFESMLRQDVGFFDTKGHSAAEMTGRLAQHPQQLQQFFSTNLGLIILTLFNLGGCSILSIAVGWQLGLVVVVAGVPLMFGAGFFRMRLEMANHDRVSKIYSEATRFASEAVSTMRTISSLTLEHKILDGYRERLETSIKLETKHKLTSMLLYAFTESVSLAVTSFAFWYGGKLLSQNKYDETTFYIIFAAVTTGSQAAGIMFGYTSDNSQAHAAANHIIHLNRSQPPINCSQGVEEAPEADEKSESVIEFRNVCFTYATRPDQPVLRSLNLKIRRGDSVGIVGASGSGKSTVIALLERFYDASSGQLLIDGVSIRKLDVHSHRTRFGLVSQDTTLYQGTIRDNILIGLAEDEAAKIASMDGDDERDPVVRACKSANIHEFIISLPEGYATNIGNRGTSLSGGQRQRLAIARALIREPDILLFDEATSALDTTSEALVQAAMEAVAREKRERTTIAVAHRLSTIKRCDRIFVMHEGEVVEEGTHEELIQQEGRYYQMVLAQTLDKEA